MKYKEEVEMGRMIKSFKRKQNNYSLVEFKEFFQISRNDGERHFVFLFPKEDFELILDNLNQLEVLK